MFHLECPFFVFYFTFPFNFFLSKPVSQVSTKVQAATKTFANIRVVTHINIKETGAYDCVLQPSTSAFIIQKLKSADRRAANKPAAAKAGKKKKKTNVVEAPKEAFQHTGNLTMDDVINIARTKYNSGAFKSLPTAVLSVVGTASSMHCTVDNKSCKEVTKMLKENYYSIPEQ